MKALLALALVLMTVPAMAEPVYAPEFNPPARYDHPFAGELDIRRIAPQYVRRACERLYNHYGSEGHDTPGCAAPTDHWQRCYIIVIDRPYGGTTPEAVLRHEIGHCNGWRHAQ